MKKSLRLILLVMAITTLSQANLLAWSEPTQITTGGTTPSLIQDSSEKYWVAFSYGGDVYMANSPDGITWGTPTKITNWGNCSLSTLIQDAGGIYRLAFGAGSAEPYKIYVMSSFDGVNWSSPVQVPTAGTSFEPCIIQDSNGKYWLTYNTYWGIYITSSDDFVNWGSSTNIVSGFMAGSWLIQDSAGKYWVAYYYHGGNWPVYITSSSNGTSWDSPIEIVSGQDDGYYNARNPELIQDSTGTYWMTYGTVDQGGKHDIALISSLDGVSWGSPVIVAGGDSDDGYTSSIIQDQSGAYWVAFPSDRSGDWNIWITSITAQEIGLFAYWKFDEGSGFIAGDSSGNGKDGIIDGATWTTGKIGDALSFDGFDDWVDVPDDISTKHITLEAWIYPTGVYDIGDQGSPIITKETGRGTPPWSESFAWRLRITPHTHKLQLQCFTPTGEGGGSTVSDTELQMGKWYHVAGTYDGTETRVYINGNLEGSYVAPISEPLVTSTLPTGIGHLPNWSVQWFQGIIDEVRVYGRALASEEIAEHAECGPGEICGVVTDSVTGEPVEGATVLIMNQWGQFEKDTRTAPDGSYTLYYHLDYHLDDPCCHIKILAEGYGRETRTVQYAEIQAGLVADFEVTPATILYVPYYNQGLTSWCALVSLSMALKHGNLDFKPWEIAAEYSLEVGEGFGYLPFLYDPIYDFCENKNHISCRERHWGGWLGEPLANMQEYVKDEIDRERPVILAMPDPCHAVVVVGYDEDDNLYINDPSGALFTALGYPEDYLATLPRSLVAERVTWEELHDGVLSKAENNTYVPVLSSNLNVGVSCYTMNYQPGFAVMPPPNRYPNQYSDELLFEHLSGPWLNQLALRLDGKSKLGYCYYDVAGHSELLHSSLRYAALPDDSLSFSPYICNTFPYPVDDAQLHLWIGQILPSGEELPAKDFGFRTLRLNPHCSLFDDEKVLLGPSYGSVGAGEFGTAFPLSSLEAGYDYCLHLEVFLSPESAEPADELSFRFHLLDQVVVPLEGGTVALPDGDTNPTNDTRIEIPEGALIEDTVISITKVDAAPAADFAIGALDPKFENPIIAYEIAARDEGGKEIPISFLTPVTLFLAYPDADNDGYVDGISPLVSEFSLRVWNWDPVLNRWNFVIPAWIDEVNNVMWLYTTHLSTFSLFPNMSPVAIKNSAIDEIEGAKSGDKKIDKELDDAIEHIRKSLGIGQKQDLWEDDSHLYPKHGHKVFDEEKKAVKKLMGKKKDTPQVVRQICQGVIEKLVQADAILAYTVYIEVLAGGDDPHVPKELNKCDKEFEKVDEELGKENYDKAIDHYKNAWEHAQKALKKLR